MITHKSLRTGGGRERGTVAMQKSHRVLMESKVCGAVHITDMHTYTDGVNTCWWEIRLKDANY